MRTRRMRRHTAPALLGVQPRLRSLSVVGERNMISPVTKCRWPRDRLGHVSWA